MTWRRWNIKPKEGEQSGTAELSRLSHRLTGRPRARADGLDIQWTLTCGYGFCRTGRTRSIDLRIKRLGVRVPPSAPAQRPLPILEWPLLLPQLLPSRSEQLVHSVCCLLPELGEHVRIRIHRHADLTVAEHLHDGPRRDALSQQERRTSVPQVLEPEQGGACGAAGPASAPGSALGGPPGARRAALDSSPDHSSRMPDVRFLARVSLTATTWTATTWSTTRAGRLQSSGDARVRGWPAQCPAVPLRPETKGQARACPDRARAIPCKVPLAGMTANRPHLTSRTPGRTIRHICPVRWAVPRGSRG